MVHNGKIDETEASRLAWVDRISVDLFVMIKEVFLGVRSRYGEYPKRLH
jgi:hypothetical protein